MREKGRAGGFIEFVAVEAKCVVECDYTLVALGVGGQYLFLSRAEDENDDWGVHLEYSDQRHSAYGCIDSCLLTPRWVEVVLAAPLDTLPAVEGFLVQYPATPEARVVLANGLRRIFRGNEGVLTIDA